MHDISIFTYHGFWRFVYPRFCSAAIKVQANNLGEIA
tara:strand:- start:441 stop:551 length:111 start_codon:yes stop_codon:yes gene_type:complete